MTETLAAEAPQTDTQFSVREVPWMKLGKLVDEDLTAAEAAQLGGLNFNVSKRPLWYGDTDDPTTAQPTNRLAERVAVVNDDTGAWLGVMSKDYPLLQYGEAFDFMDAVNPRYVAAGALKGGRQGFMVVRTSAQLKLPVNDPHDLFAVLRTSHDGSRAVEVMVMPLRGHCMNQLTLRSFVSGVEHRWSVKHTTTMHEKLQDAQVSLQKLGIYADAYATNVYKLLKVKLTDDQARQTLESALPDRPKRADTVERIISTWHTSETVGFDWTGWGLVNAVSEYFDWGRSGGSSESRFLGALQGQTHTAINRVAGRVLSRY